MDNEDRWYHLFYKEITSRIVTIDGFLSHIVTSSDYDGRSNYIEKFMFLYLVGILDTISLKILKQNL